MKNWREEFTDKFERKYGALVGDDRQKKILEKIEKERKKYYIGEKFKKENEELIKDYRRRVQAKSLNKFIKDGREISNDKHEK